MSDVLLVEDDDGIAELLTLNLDNEGMRVERVEDAETALLALTRSEPRLIVLDLGLPGMDGLDFCRVVRRTRRTPLLIVTARRDEADKVRGLELGADDYVTKPFGVKEVLARIHALLRRAEAPPLPTRRFGGLAVDIEAKTVSLAGKRVDLTATEYRILDILTASPGRVFSREQILDRLSEDGGEAYERTIDSHLARLRRKLGDDPEEPRFIETARGLGYRFRATSG